VIAIKELPFTYIHSRILENTFIFTCV